MIYFLVLPVIACILVGVIVAYHLIEKQKNKNEMFQAGLTDTIIKKIKECPDNRMKININKGIYIFGNIEILSLQNEEIIIKKPVECNINKNFQKRIKEAINNKIVTNLEEKVETNDLG